MKFATSSPYNVECSDTPVSDAPGFVCPSSIYFQINADAFKSDEGKARIYSDYIEATQAYTLWVLNKYGITDATRQVAHEQGDTGRAGDINRRYNLVEICLVGMYHGSQYKDDPDEAEFFDYFYKNTDNINADTNKAGTIDNPSGQHKLDWFRKGIDSDGNPSVCNTWIAPASEVS